MPSLFRTEFEAARTGVAKGVSGAISVTTQVAIAAGVISMSGALGPSVVKVPAQSLQYVSTVFLPPPPAELAPLPAEAVRPAVPREVETPEPAALRPDDQRRLKPSLSEPIRAFENHAPLTPLATEVLPVEFASRPTPPAPEPPKPIVGAFANSAAIAKSPEPTRRVESAGFNAPVAESPHSTLGTTSVGAFNTATNAGSPQRGAVSANAGQIADTGFNRPTSAAPTQPARVIRDTGFGSAASTERQRTSHHLDAPKTAGFNDARIVDASVRRVERAPQAPSVIPVEVLSKPTPVYTEAARRLKIEGEVVLEVEFLATGSIRIIRIVRGLGHGLDEAAQAAAYDIRFKPATSEGRAVDSRTTVQIVFRLA